MRISTSHKKELKKYVQLLEYVEREIVNSKYDSRIGFRRIGFGCARICNSFTWSVFQRCDGPPS